MGQISQHYVDGLEFRIRELNAKVTRLKEERDAAEAWCSSKEDWIDRAEKAEAGYAGAIVLANTYKNIITQLLQH